MIADGSHRTVNIPVCRVRFRECGEGFAAPGSGSRPMLKSARARTTYFGLVAAAVSQCGNCRGLPGLHGHGQPFGMDKLIMPISIIALFLGAFCIGTTEFVVAGLLPEISNDLHVSVPRTGYLASAYAIGFAIGEPTITLATARFPRKINLLLLMFVFVSGHVWCAPAPNFGILLIGRLIVALSHGSFLA
jgi:hypothetical protein